MTLDEFTKDRVDALVSLDEGKIKSYMRKYEVGFPPVELFWVQVHKAITGDKLAPMWARAASKKWLLANGWNSLDDGDVEPPAGGRELARYIKRLRRFGLENSRKQDRT